MDRAATLDRVADLTAQAAAQGAQLVAFPEVFLPGTPIWIDIRPIWDGDEDWYRLLAENAVVVPGPASERLGAIARESGVWLVIGVEEREQHGGPSTTPCCTSPPKAILSIVTESSCRQDRSEPCGAWATGRRFASWIRLWPGRRADLLGELHAPRPVPHVRAGVDLWLAPTLAIGYGWIATLQQYLARENRMFVVRVNPVLHADQIPAAFPHRERLVPPAYMEENGAWLEEGNTVIIGPNGDILAGPVRQKEETLIVEVDLGAVLAGRRHMDPVDHYNRPDVFRLHVDMSPRPAFVETSPGGIADPRESNNGPTG